MQQGGRSGRHSEHLGLSSASCSRCSGPFRGRHGDGSCQDDTICAGAPGTAASQVVDPEIPCSRSPISACCARSRSSDGRVEVAITPTYSGCPAMNMIALEIELALERAGIRAADDSHRGVAGLDHGLDERGRPRQASGVRYCAAAGLESAARCSANSRWRVRNAARDNTEAAVRIRLDLLQGAVALQELPRTVRLFQVSLRTSMSSLRAQRSNPLLAAREAGLLSLGSQ